MIINKSHIKAIRDSLQVQLDMISDKYNSEHHELVLASMTKEDREAYLAIFDSVSFYKEILGYNGNITIVENR